jgi:hypothetical protein
MCQYVPHVIIATYFLSPSKNDVLRFEFCPDESVSSSTYVVASVCKKKINLLSSTDCAVGSACEQSEAGKKILERRKDWLCIK